MRTKDAYGTSTKTSNDKNGDRKLEWKGKQVDRHRVEFEMEIRAEWKLEWNRKSEGKKNRMERQKPQKWKGKQSMGKNITETQKEEIWNITPH